MLPSAIISKANEPTPAKRSSSLGSCGRVRPGHARPRSQYRCAVSEIRDATEDDFEAEFDLLDSSSRAAFGTSQQKRAYLREHWELPATGKWVAVENGAIVGYAE